MKIRIHRGTKEIGGTCIEVEADGSRILLDLGLPLDGNPSDPALYPEIEGFDGEGCLKALILSHGHMDHWGLAHLAGSGLPIYLGGPTLRIMQAAYPFLPNPYVPLNPRCFDDRSTFRLGPFSITPHLVDHSAFDAYAFEVETSGRRIFYSGDFRGHGRKAPLFERMLRQPPANVDVMLMEGSTLGRLPPDASFPTEAEVESAFTNAFQSARGLALVAASAQNIDRMVSIYRAAKRSGRTLLIDLYAAEVLKATGNPNIPQAGWENIALFVPHYQRVQIKKTRRFDLLKAHASYRIFEEDLAEIAPRAVMLFRAPMLRDLDAAKALTGSLAIWSQWEGYLEREAGQNLMRALQERDVPLRKMHTSGHASIGDLRRLTHAVNPKRLVPIHTFQPGGFHDHFANVDQKQDGVWWEV